FTVIFGFTWSWVTGISQGCVMNPPELLHRYWFSCQITVFQDCRDSSEFRQREGMHPPTFE
ncbi:MAG: hypothetical protein WC379_11685, partial [Methanoregula sp.]